MRNAHFGPAVAAAGLVAALAGCNPAREKPAAGNAVAPKSASSVVPVKEIRDYQEALLLPSATVYGMETTQIMSKISGYVKTIGRVKGREIDIGTVVDADTVLAVIYAPEIDDDLAEKRALVKQAEADVAQALAAIEQAKKTVAEKQAAVKQELALLKEKKAVSALRQKQFDRIKNQKGSISDEIREDIELKRDAAIAGVDSAIAAVEVAKKHIEAAEEDENRAVKDKEAADTRVKVAEAKVKRAETLSRYRIIRAPFPGTITKRMVHRGTFVRQATSNSGAKPMFELTRTDRVRIVVSAPNTIAPRIGIGQTAIFHTIGGRPGVTIEGTVTRMAGAFNARSRMMRIEIHVDGSNVDAQWVREKKRWKRPEKPGNGKAVQVSPGIAGTVTLIRNWPKLRVIPTSALVSKDGHDYAIRMTSKRGGKPTFERTLVTVVFNDAKTVGISGGLKVGDLVATQGAAALGSE
ncbi:MAG: efflux RND transporter periplasmic adaptor subunit [Planctomycetaceae bacterium]